MLALQLAAMCGALAVGRSAVACEVSPSAVLALYFASLAVAAQIIEVAP